MLTAMSRRLSTVGLVLAMVFAMTAAFSAQAAHADGSGACLKWNVDAITGTKTCALYDTTGGGNGGGTGDGFSNTCVNNHITYEGKNYVCNLGSWSFSYGCYLQPLSQQPSPTDPIWGQNDPSTSRAQWEDCTNIPPTTVGAKEIVGPCVGACGGPNPVQTVTNQLSITKPALGMSPDGTQPGGTKGFVNQNIWFWSHGLDTSTQTRTAGNVVGTRTFTSADWVVTLAGSSGASSTVATLHCASDNEYAATDGSAASPDPQCGYQFKTSGVYTVTVTTTWNMAITQNGVAAAPQTVTSTANTATITIAEGQSTNG